MTVTSDPAELRAAAGRASALGMHAMAAELLNEAIDNNTAARRDSTARAQAAADIALAAAETALSRTTPRMTTAIGDDNGTAIVDDFGTVLVSD